MLQRLTLKHITAVIISLKVGLLLFLILKIAADPQHSAGFSFNQEFFIFVGAGFLAQFIDGTLGMAYGVSCSTLLLSFGVPPAVATASVHTAEVFTTGVSGLSHLYLQNVNKSLFFRILIPGVLGAVLGAYLISEVLDGKMIKPYISLYLLILGSLILYKSYYPMRIKREVKRLYLLGLAGGFLDAIGGGGWGPIVTSNLIVQGKTPQETIGTVNTAEFFIAFSSTGVFLLFIGMENWPVIAGLITGGVLAAPIGALLAKRIHAQVLMRLVGIAIVLVSIYSIIVSLR